MSFFKSLFSHKGSKKGSNNGEAGDATILGHSHGKSRKICVGDTVIVDHRTNKHRGNVKFVGPDHTGQLRIGIDIGEAKGENFSSDGRQYFQCKDKYGILVMDNHIISIERSVLTEIRISVEDRVVVEGRGEGIVRFVGEIIDLKGYWFGVELDKRVGRHDGTIKNIRYYRCKPMHGIHTPFDKLSLVTESGDVISSQSQPNLLPTDNGPTPVSSSPPPSESYQKLATSAKTLNTAQNRKNTVETKAAKLLLSDEEQADPKQQKKLLQRTRTINILFDDSGDKKPSAKVLRKFQDDYDFDEIEDELGDGEFGTVYKCRYKKGKVGKHHKYYAVKKIKKAKLHHISPGQQRELVTRLRQEIRLLKTLRRQKRKKLPGYKNVVKFKDVYEDRNYLYVITNLCTGGSLWKKVEQANQITEAQSQALMKQVLEGLMFLSVFNIAHLDLKPDNIMFATDKDNAPLQIIDFGMARIIPRLKKSRLMAGTPHFIAPEVLNGIYDVKADVWSCGVILFLLLFGFPPFFDDDPEEMDMAGMANDDGIFKKILSGFIPEVRPGQGNWFPEEIPCSQPVKDLLSKMLLSNPSGRLTVKECLDHPWFRQAAPEKMLSHTVHDAFTRFSAQCHFRVLISQIFAYKVTPQENQDLREVFGQFDVNGDGKISLEEFKKGMMQYKLGYSDQQLTHMFNALDIHESHEIEFENLLAAFSYQRLVASDERLYEAFREIDTDEDGHITKRELMSKIKQLKVTLDPESARKAQQLLDKLEDNPEKKHARGPTPRIQATPSGRLEVEPTSQEVNSAFQQLSTSIRSTTSNADGGSSLSLEEQAAEAALIADAAAADDNESGASASPQPNLVPPSLDMRGVDHQPSMSKGVGSAIQWADLDMDGQIDYEEFLRSLHPDFNEGNVTPPHLASTPTQSNTDTFSYVTSPTKKNAGGMWSNMAGGAEMKEDESSDDSESSYETDYEDDSDEESDDDAPKGNMALPF